MTEELVNRVQMGATRDTELAEAVEKNFRGETMEVGLYLAMARQAQREGFPEIARVLHDIAMEEAAHAAQYAEMNGLISASTRENLVKMLHGEINANKGKREAAVKAKEIGIDQAHDLFDESSRDEARHAQALEGLLKRYFPEA
jgi:rubrerythrin